MKRPNNFEDLLNIAKSHPDLLGALSQLGVHLKQVGYSMGGERWQTETKSGKSGDLSAIVFIHKPNGTWNIIDNKGRTGSQYMDSISLLRDIFNVSFDDAVYMLSGGTPQSPLTNPKKIPTLEREVKIQEKVIYTPPTEAPDKLRNIKAYLIQTRKLPNELVLPLIDNNKIYAAYIENKETQKQSLVCAFRITDENGNDIGCDSCSPLAQAKFKHVVSGSNTNYAWCFPYEIAEITAETPIYFCEAPIDAMSLCALSGTPGIYVSMAGLKDSTFQSMTEKLGGTPIICVDNDEAGDKFALRHSDIQRLTVPFGKDWNDTLKYYVENKLSYAFASIDATANIEEQDQKKENGALNKSEPSENYLQETTDGRLVAIINTDILDGIYTGTWDRTIEENIKKAATQELKKFNKGIAVNDLIVTINKTSRREFTRSNVTKNLFKKSPELFAEKMRAAVSIDNIIVSMETPQNDGGLKKNRSDDFVDFYRGKTLFCIKETQYEGTVLIGKTKNEQFIFYDLLEISPSSFVLDKKRKISSTVTPTSAFDDMRDLSVDSITENSEKVNTIDEKFLKQLNDESPLISDKNEKNSQDELRATLEEKLKNVVENYRADPHALAEYILFTSKFNNYSANNLRLIWSQYPHAQYVTSAYDFSHGLPDKNGKPTTDKIFIKKGEQSLRIWKPYDVKYVVTPQGEEKRSSWLTKSERELATSEKWKELKRTYFTLVPVFDITQTTASADIYPKLCGLGGTKGTSADTNFESLKNYCENVLNCPVTICDFKERKATVRGSFFPDLNEIHISDMLEGENKLSTFIHEMGHATLHHDSYQNATKSTAQIELEADMYALMVERRLGIEPTDARCSHLKAHYDKYLAEIKSTDITADTEVFNNVIDRFREQIPLIDAYIDNQSISNAQLIDHSESQALKAPGTKI